MKAAQNRQGKACFYQKCTCDQVAVADSKSSMGEWTKDVNKLLNHSDSEFKMTVKDDNI